MFGFNMFADSLRPFNTTYRCYSVSMLPGNERHDVEKGGKIIMPPSALDHLTRLNIVYPMLFKLTNPNTNRVTHCGVLEFVADEGKVYLPYWMMRNLLLDEGYMVKVESTSLPVATFSKFQPQSVDFLDITNPKAVLENALRNFACLTTGDVIAIDYNDRIYELCVLETRPGPAVTIIECDMNVEFAPPVGYKEPSKPSSPDISSDSEKLNKALIHEDFEREVNFRAFSGKGNRLDGKQKHTESPHTQSFAIVRRGIPDYDYKIGTLTFIRVQKSVETDKNKEEKNEKTFTPFTGEGQQLHKPRQ
ncbi:ubiquitin fusion degradation protein 1-like protein [Dinothrombium tinctorium]|uniref:Ubiquitin fusion degradation protein 1 homolog n=1 Tax=Dinothrombium tinctorium TaxID=1965070 RepID=A0A3S3NUU7_9ACAR|nr:ubiquitin fusion degradation protein 1-like protein [Dinothrombium tinctorium]